MFVWQKSVAPESVPEWAERLAFVGAERLAVLERPGIQRPRVEVYLPTRDSAQALAAAFGGSVREVTDAQWQPQPGAGKPLSIAGRLAITGRPEELAALREAGPALCVPAAMAFGTGEHATTAMCLRLLAEVARQRRGSAWEMLDLGMGSGILALAARVWGAEKALGFDNDPHAVRTAKENAALNGVAQVQFRQLDLIRSWRPERTWPVIAANLFSGLILELLPRIRQALAPEGRLIVSGILATQALEVQEAFTANGLNWSRRRKGRWVAFVAQASL